MPQITRRAALALGLAATLPRFAIAQADTRPVATIAVQRIANSNTLDNLREQSNVGERVSLVQDWTVPEFDLPRARDLIRQAGYKGDPIPYRLLNNYYTNQVNTARVLVEMWREAGLNAAIEMKENWTQIRDRSTPRAVRDWSAGATFNDPVGSLVAQFGPNGAAQQAGEYANEELSRLCVALETGTDPAERHRIFARLLQIAEREDPAYIVLHQNATFTAKRRNLRWRPSPSFALDFRPGNFAA